MSTTRGCLVKGYGKGIVEKEAHPPFLWWRQRQPPSLCGGCSGSSLTSLYGIGKLEKGGM